MNEGRIRRLAAWGRLAVLILGLAATAAWAVGEMEGLSLTPDLSPVWIPVEATAAQSLQAWGWRLPGSALGGLVIAAYVVLIVWVASLYLAHSLEQPGHFWLLPPVLLLLFVGAGLALVSADPFLPYLFPVAAFSMLLAVLIDVPLSIMATVLTGLAIGYADNASLALTTYAVIGALVGALSLKWTERRYRLLWAGAYVALSNVAVVLIFSLSGGELDPLGLSQFLVIGIANGFLSAGLASMSFFAVNILRGRTSSLQLLELAQPTRPLLRQLLQRAPGTYHHSLMVSSLAEQAAEQVGGDALLVRVGALYHDVGKILQPEFFVENQQSGLNGHDRLDPQASAQIIIDHVKKGLDLARKNGLPREVRAFITEHHGTTLVKFFYHQAVEQAGDPTQVNEADFRYPGPRPRSKETAVVMLADGCEAAVRAGNPASVEEIARIVEGIIMDRASSGELDESGLTMHEINVTRDTFVRMLQGALHHRVKYPEENAEQPAVPPVPAAGGLYHHRLRGLLTRLGL